VKFYSILLCLLLSSNSYAQKFNGYVITDQNVKINGHLTLLKDAQGKKISVNDGKSYFVRTFYIHDLKSYAYKKDTFMVLPAFYPFGSDYLAEDVVVEVRISKGKLKLYYGELPDFYPYTYTTVPTGSPNGVGVTAHKKRCFTYIIQDDESLYGVQKGDDFIKSISIPLADNEILMKRIKNKELKYKDMVEIITLYNAGY